MPPKAKAKARAAAQHRPETVLARTVRLAVQAGNEPVLSKNGQSLYIPKAGGGKIFLEKSGRILKAGQAYYKHLGNPIRSRTVQEINWDQPVSWDRSGRNSFITGRDGRKHMVTRWNEVKQQGIHTALGRKYLERSEQTLVVTVPILFHVKATQREWEADKLWSDAVDSRGEVRALRAQTPQERQDFLRDEIAMADGVTQLDGRTLLWEESEHLAFLNPNKDFQIQEIQVLSGGRAGLADLPAQRAAPLRYCYLKSSISELSFDPNIPDGRCVIHQLSPALGLTEEQVEAAAQESFDLRYGEGRKPHVHGEPNAAYDVENNAYACPLTGELVGLEEGVTAQSIVDICRQYDTPARVFDPLGRVLVEWMPPGNHRRGIYCTLVGRHAYFHSEAQLMASVPAKEPVRGSVRLPTDEDSDDEEERDYKWLDAGDSGTGVEKGSHYLCSDASKLRETLLERGIVPKMYLKGLHKVRKLAYNGATVHEVADREWATIKRLLDGAGLRWCNDGWGRAVYRIAVQTVRPKRRAIPKTVQDEVRGRGLCEHCKNVPGAEIHHIQAVSEYGTNRIENLAWLCKVCHKAVGTTRVSKSPFTSYFTERTREVIESHKTRAFVHRIRESPRGGTLQHFDVKSCRKEVLWSCQDPWPIFCVHDRIESVLEPVELHPGLYYLEVPVEYQSTLDGDGRPECVPPLRTRGWYSAATVRFALERKLCTWANVTHRIVASSSLPADFFRPILERFDDLARNLGNERLAKQLYCAFVGSLSIEKSYQYSLIESECKDEVCTLLEGRTALTSWRSAGGRQLFEAVLKEEVRTIASTLPIAIHVLQGEACLLARIAETVRSIPTAIVLEYNTDSVLAWSSKRHGKRVREEVLALEHPDSKRICRTVDPPELLQCFHKPPVSAPYRNGRCILRWFDENRVRPNVDILQHDGLVLDWTPPNVPEVSKGSTSALETAIRGGCGADRKSWNG